MALALLAPSTRPYRKASVPPPDFEVDYRTGAVSDIRGGLMPTYTGGANGTRVNERGQIVVGSAPRIDHRRRWKNRLRRSNNLTVAPWNTVGATPTNNVLRGPSGEQTAGVIVEDTADNQHYIEQKITQDAVVPCAFSVTLLPHGRSDVSLKIYDFSATTNYLSIRVNPYTGDIVQAAAATGTAVLSGFSVVRDGAGFRVSLAGTPGPSVGGDVLFRVSLFAGGVGSYPGDGVSGVGVCNGQVTVGTTIYPFVPTDDAPVTMADRPALRIEGARTNDWTPSIYTGAGSWALTNAASSVANAAEAPDGTATAFKLVPDAGATGYASKNIAHTAGVARTQSVFAQYAPGGFTTWVLLAPSGLFTTSPGTNRSATFNLLTGAVVATSGGDVAARVEDWGDGLYRLCLTYTPEVTVSVGIQMRSPGVGDGAKGVYLWGAQNEVGLIPSTYIHAPVAGAVTRTGERAPVLDPQFSALYNTAEGTLAGRATAQHTVVSGLARAICSISRVTSTANDIELLLYRLADSRRIGSINAGGSQFAQSPGGVVSDATGAIAFATDNTYGAWAGTARFDDTSVTLPTGLGALNIGHNDAASGSELYGHVEWVRYWRTQVTKTQCELIANDIT
jgi:hypothetical protein